MPLPSSSPLTRNVSTLAVWAVAFDVWVPFVVVFVAVLCLSAGGSSVTAEAVRVFCGAAFGGGGGGCLGLPCE